MSKKKVVFVVMNLNVGGIETYLLRFLTYCGTDIDAYIICKNGERKWSLTDSFEKIGAKVVGFDVGVYPSFKYYSLFKFLRELKPDSIVDFTGDFSAFALLIAKMLGIPNRIIFYRESRYQFNLNLLKEYYTSLLHRIASSSSSRILSNSQEAINYFYRKNGFIPNKIKVINNGIDVGRFITESRNLRKELEIPEDAIVIGNVGRYVPAKNHPTMLNIATRVCSDNPNVYFLFCGKGVSKIKVPKEFTNKIRLIEFVENVKLIYNTIDYFLFLSLNEGFPNVLVEAMLSKLPIIASNIPSNLEVLHPFIYNNLFDPFDVNGVVNYLGNMIRGVSVNIVDTEEVFQFAVCKYDSKILFEEFKLEL